MNATETDTEKYVHVLGGRYDDVIGRFVRYDEERHSTFYMELPDGTTVHVDDTDEFRTFGRHDKKAPTDWADPDVVFDTVQTIAHFENPNLGPLVVVQASGGVVNTVEANFRLVWPGNGLLNDSGSVPYDIVDYDSYNESGEKEYTDRLERAADAAEERLVPYRFYGLTDAQRARIAGLLGGSPEDTELATLLRREK